MPPQRRFTARVLPRAVVLPALAALGLAQLAGCTTQPSVNRRPHAGAGTASTVGGAQQITVKTDDTYRFDPSTITVHPGRVVVVLINNGNGAPHNWTLPALPGAATPLASSGQSQTVTFTAPAAGRYTFVCTIHRKQGQTGTLVVLPS